MEKSEKIKFVCQVALPITYVAIGTVLLALWGQIAVNVFEIIDSIGRAI